MKKMLLLGLLGLFGCSETSKELNVIILDQNLCIFSKESKDYSADDVALYVRKVDPLKLQPIEYKNFYKNIKIPVDENHCIHIPLDELEKNKAYNITLSTINKTFQAQVCILKQKDGNIIKAVKAGESTCN